MSVPNQKIVHIASRETRDKDHLYMMANIEALSRAVRELKGSGLQMWLYFNKNQDNYKFELSQKDALNFGVKKDSYYNGIKDLEEKGYLIPLRSNTNIYLFYETPPSDFAKICESEKAIWFSETPTEPLENSKNDSEKPERNNTYNTEIIKNNTLNNDTAVGGIVNCGEATIHCESDFQQRFEKLIISSDKVYDGSYLLDKYL